MENLNQLTQQKLAVQMFIEEGNQLQFSRNFPEAIKSYTKAIAKDAENGLAYHKRGWSKAHIGDIEGELEDWSKCIELAPNFAEVYADRAIAYATLRKYEEALADAKKAMELNPELRKILEPVLEKIKETSIETNNPEEIIKTGNDRREFLKKITILGVAAATIPLTGYSANEQASKKVKWGMVIDLQKCTGCGGCTLACKNENNVPDGMFWASKISETVGTFPNVRYDYMPTLCNHCDNAPCVKVCPTSAMHKIDGGITMHNPEKCIGCRYCMTACPYRVISFNDRTPHTRWRENTALIKGCTSGPEELTNQVGAEVIPYSNPDRNKGYAGIRPNGVVEKCTLCNHRVKDGEQPYCVEKCPSKARIFGDLNDPDSNVNYLINKYKPLRLKEHLGTEPKVYYIRSFNPGSHHV